MSEIAPEIAPFSDDLWECPKCGEADYDLKHVPIGAEPSGQTWAQEHLRFECATCGYVWRTLTKDALAG